MIENLITNILKILNNNKLEIIEVERKKINASGMLVLSSINSFIAIANDLNSGLKIFVLLHELGHICLNYITHNSNFNYSSDVEKECDLWAIHFLEQCIKKSTLNKLIYLAEQQGELYDYISKSYEFDELYKYCATRIFKNESRCHSS